MDAQKFLNDFSEKGARWLSRKHNVSLSTVYCMKARALRLSQGRKEWPGNHGQPKKRFKQPAPQSMAAVQNVTGVSPAAVALDFLAAREDRIFFHPGLDTWFVYTDESGYFEQHAGPRPACLELQVEAFLVSRGADPSMATDVLDRMRSLLCAPAYQEKLAKMDTQTQYLVFKNGVFNRHTGKLESPSPAQMQSCTALIDYIPWSKLPEDSRALALEFTQQLWPDLTQRESVLKLFGAALFGNTEKQIVVMGFLRNTGKATFSQSRPQ